MKHFAMMAEKNGTSSNNN